MVVVGRVCGDVGLSLMGRDRVGWDVCDCYVITM